jgi:hypothetical protein
MAHVQHFADLTTVQKPEADRQLQKGGHRAAAAAWPGMPMMMLCLQGTVAPCEQAMAMVHMLLQS